MNNYDAWLTNASRDDAPPCACGHAFDDHNANDCCTECDCERYEAQEPPERDPDEAYERRREARYS